MQTNLAVRHDEEGWESAGVLVVRLDVPETRLMAAVLESAISEWLLRRETCTTPRHPRRVTLDEDVPGWFTSTDRSWPYSFENICGALGFDADTVRRRLRIA